MAGRRNGPPLSMRYDDDDDDVGGPGSVSNAMSFGDTRANLSTNMSFHTTASAACMGGQTDRQAGSRRGSRRAMLRTYA